jgi:hypothetical protein
VPRPFRDDALAVVVARRVRGVALAVVVTSAVTTACSIGGDGPRDDLVADTARFTYSARSVVVSLTACGREGDVVVLAGTSGGTVLQAEADLGDGGADRTGVTVDLGGDGIFGAFGAEMEHGPAGEITEVRVEGDRLIVEGTWVPLDDELTAQPSAAGALPGRLVARCPETDDETAAL